jgi:hypothetical protein
MMSFGAARRALASATVVLCASMSGGVAQAQGSELVVPPDRWKTIPSESGPVNYYSLVNDPAGAYVHARYLPGWKTTVLGVDIPEADRRRIRKVRWTWRAVTLPNGGDECANGKSDSAAVVYITWKRGLRYHALKYVWSATGQRGRVCERKRNPFVAQDTIILESGGPLSTWRTEEIDLAAEYRRHFENNDPTAELPDLVGIGLMTDGDQTKSESAADYGTFFLLR